MGGHTSAAPGDFKSEGDAGKASKGMGGHVPIVCDAECLLSLKREEIYVLRPRLEIAMTSGSSSGSSEHDAAEAKKKTKETADNMPADADPSTPARGVSRCRFFRNMLPDIPIAVSQPAGHFFLEEDFELALLKEGTCAFSRQPPSVVGDYGPV